MMSNPRTGLASPGADRLEPLRPAPVPAHCGHCLKPRVHFHATPGGNRVCGRCFETALDILYGELRKPAPK